VISRVFFPVFGQRDVLTSGRDRLRGGAVGWRPKVRAPTCWRAAQLSTASCEADEVMISAYCSGTFAYPLVPLENGERCGNNPRSVTLRVTIVCAKR